MGRPQRAARRIGDGAFAVLAMIVVGCTSVTGGDASVAPVPYSLGRRPVSTLVIWRGMNFSTC
ncbi:hypothetical protein H7I76_25295 [Mycolicibacterium vaccae]|nr:hypothetical protein [Mycolicibacterium vaccae]